jgi:hypothetical protein
LKVFNQMAMGDLMHPVGDVRQVESTGVAMYEEAADEEEEDISGRPRTLRRFR